MTDELLLQRTDDQIVTMMFNRPQARNAMSWNMLLTFRQQMQTLVNDPDVKVLIVTGAGDQAFCSGGDLLELSEKATKADGAALSSIMTEALHLLETAPFPSIAAMNGYALGGGSEIALACDFRVIDENAYMGLVQLRLGLTPGWGAGQRLLNLVGYSRALQILLESEPYEPAALAQLGLVNVVAPAGTALNMAIDFARKIARRDSAAVQAVKRVLRYGLTMPYDEARIAEQQEFPELWASEAHLQAVDKFLRRKGDA